MSTAEHPQSAEAASSRHAAVTRREWLRQVAILGVAGLLQGLAGCSNDAAVFGNATAAPQSTGSSPTSLPNGTPVFPDGGEVVVRFTYAPTRSYAANPYIAVWFEDSAGEWVETIALWFMQNQEGLGYLRDLRRWSRADGTRDTVDTISGPTRRPGDYAVVWGGRDAKGSAVLQGEYHVCIESVREDGPYSLIREPIRLEGEPLTITMADNGELSSATAEFRRG